MCPVAGGYTLAEYLHGPTHYQQVTIQSLPFAQDLLDDDLDADLVKYKVEKSIGSNLSADGDVDGDDDEDLDDMDDDMDDDMMDDDLDEDKFTVETQTTFRTESGHEVVMSVVMPRAMATTNAGIDQQTTGATQPHDFGGGVTIEAVKVEKGTVSTGTGTGSRAAGGGGSGGSTTATLTNATEGNKMAIAVPPSPTQLIWIQSNHPPPPPLYAIKQHVSYEQVSTFFSCLNLTKI